MARFFSVAIAVALALCAGAAVAADTPGSAAAFPTKSIRFIVPYAAGGNPDTLARNIGAKLREVWGQPVIVDNRTGANGTIACETTAHSPRDGYTLLMGSVATHALNPAMFKNPPYDPIADFTPITQVGHTSLILVAHPSVQAGTAAELAALAKTKRLTYGSVGVGSAGHLAGELFNTMTGAGLVHVPYKGMPPAVSDLLGGQISLTFANMLVALPHIRAGKLKPIGVTGMKRLAVLPDVPTITETLPGYEVIMWWGVFAPAGTPRPIVDILNREIVKILADPALRQFWAEQDAELVGSRPEEFAAFVKAERDRWAPVVEKSGVREK